MLKLLAIFFTVFSLSLSGNSFNDKDLEIVAKQIDTKDNILTASGDVVIYSKSTYITAGKLIYDKKNSTIELFDDISILRDDKVSFSQYLFLDLNKEKRKIKPLLLLDNSSRLWFNSEESNATSDSFILNQSRLSSCDCNEPDWSIGFSEGDYNTTKKWINTYNTTLYVKDFPILYTPYFGFPTDKTRRTGLLAPTLGYSNAEGLLYAQPIFFAPTHDYDFEYIPQIRTTRGHGNYLKFRYKDSKYSLLKIEGGIFKEKLKYKNDFKLVNAKHYGWKLDYDRSKLFSKEDHTDGLKIEYEDMNDVDYINTKYDSSTENYTDKFLESKLKYYYNTNGYYFDFDVKLYNDISKNSNDDVMQTIPAINVHKYKDKFFLKDLSYSLDIKSKRETRKVGIGAHITDIYIPISYNKELFDGYLNLELTEQVNYTNIDYTNENRYKNGNFGRNNHMIKLYTDLTKPYENYLHTLKFDISYTKPASFKKDGYIYEVTSEEQNLSIFPVTQSKENISLGLNHSFFSKKTKEQILNHRVNQVYTYNNIKKEYEEGNLENDLIVYYGNTTFSNRVFYNHELNKIVSSIIAVKYDDNKYFFDTYYDYKRDESSLEVSKNIIYDLGFKFNKFYSIGYKEEYDLVKNLSRKKQYRFNIDDKCWALSFKYVDSILASNTTDDTALRQKTFYVEFNLKQLFNMRQSYKLKER